jgi:hypothetical protein
MMMLSSIKAYVIFMTIIFCLFENGLSRIIFRRSNPIHKTALLNSNVELTCDLTAYYGSDVQWRKVEGVCVLNISNSFVLYSNHY